MSKPKIQYHDDGYFIVLFQTATDCLSVIEGGSYTMGGNPAVVKRWSQHFNLHDELRITPLWVRFPRLLVVY